jgi:uncharacterized membrane protein YhhN
MTSSAKARGLAFVAVVAASGYVVGLWRDGAMLRLATKPVPVLCLLVWVLARDRDRYARLIAAGLALSALGDVLLELPGLFVAGLGAFLCAHISYIMAFLTESTRPRLLRATPFLIWLALAYTRMRPGLGGMAVPVTVYVIVVGVMMWRAAARIGEVPSALPSTIGAVLFGLSDTLIGLDRFHAPIPGVRYPIIFLYWAGQMGISLSRRRTEPGGR